MPKYLLGIIIPCLLIQLIVYALLIID